MPNLSTLILKNVLSKADCRILGFVKDVYFDKFCKKAVYFLCGTDDGSFYLFPYSEMTALNDVAVLDDGVSLIRPCDADLTVLVCGLLSKSVFDGFGCRKGEIKDVIMDDKGKVLSIELKGGGLSPNQIGGVGDVVILKDVKKKTVRRRMPRAVEDRKVTILDGDIVENDEETSYATDENEGGLPGGVNGVEEQAAIQSGNAGTTEKSAEIKENIETNTETSSDCVENGVKNLEIKRAVLLSDALKGLDVAPAAYDHAPPRVIADYNFLLGRILCRDLKSYTGEVLAEANTFVTIDTVELARKYGKLVDLTLNSK